MIKISTQKQSHITRHRHHLFKFLTYILTKVYDKKFNAKTSHITRHRHQISKYDIKSF